MKIKPHELVLLAVLSLLGWFLLGTRPGESRAGEGPGAGEGASTRAAAVWR